MKLSNKSSVKEKKSSKTVLRVIKMLFSFYPVMMPVSLVCVIISAIVSSIPAVFMQNVISVIERSWQSGDWDSVAGEIIGFIGILIILYILSLAASIAFTQMMAVITQGTLKKLREKMFNGMQDLPIKFFDTNNHGDIMSYYTNDIDTLRQMISQSFPQLLISTITVLTVFIIMMYYSLWLTVVVLLGVTAMIFITKKVGGNSARYFIKQQSAIGKTEGYVEEIMNGQKVVKVFCHEEESKKDFDRVNDELFSVSEKANKFANMLMPILNNIGNVLYVIVAFAGGVLLLANCPNISISGLAFSISIVVPFLNMTKQFAGNISQVSIQINSVVMGIAGARRIFGLIDEQPEPDDGYVTLVNVKEIDGKITECSERTGLWAWRHPHSADGSVTYTILTVSYTHLDVYKRQLHCRSRLFSTRLRTTL